MSDSADGASAHGAGAAYYAGRLSADRLRRCYEVAPPRVRRYLEAEIDHVLHAIEGAGSVLELGCGYGRVAARLTAAASLVFGIDTSLPSLALARAELAAGRCRFAAMDAARLGLLGSTFDAVVCVQNGVCAFRADPLALASEAVRVTRPGGRVLLSTYADAFWTERLEWFERQAEEGLVGPIDRGATHRGEIVCRDGFRSGTFRPEDFLALGRRLGRPCRLVEVDASSLFCELTVA